MIQYIVTHTYTSNKKQNWNLKTVEIFKHLENPKIIEKTQKSRKS